MRKLSSLKKIKFSLKIILLIIFVLVSYMFLENYLKAKYLTLEQFFNIKYKDWNTLTENDYIKFNDRTPRNLFTNFYYKALGTWTGYLGGYYDALNCITPKIIKQNEYIDDEQNINADKLLVTMLETSFRFDEVPTTTTSNKLDITLGKGWNKQTFYIKKKKNGDWYFTKENFENPKTIEKFKRYKKDWKASEDDIRNLSMPILAYMNFSFGVNQELGFNIEDALNTMDLQWIPPVIRQEYGEFVAYAMSKVLEYAKINLSDVPGKTLKDNNIVMLYVSPKTKKAVYLSRIKNDKLGGVKWQFSKEAQHDALKIYFENLDITNPREPLFFSIKKDLWGNIPSLMHSKHWKHFYAAYILILSVMIFYITYKIFKVLIGLFLKSINFLTGNKDYECSVRLSSATSLMVALFTSGYLFFNAIIAYMDIYLYFYYISRIIFGIILIFLCIEIINMICSYLVSFSISSEDNKKGSRFTFVVAIVNKLINLLLIIIITGFILQDLGVNMVQFLTAVGIGGLAVALAGKDTIENLFGSVMLALERPFKIGDWVVVDGFEGNVEQIGLRSTTIRTFENSALTIPNYAFITSKINNMGARTYRRYKTTLEIDDKTSLETIKNYVKSLDKLVQNTPYMKKKGYHIRINDIGATSINIMIYVFFVSLSWGEELKQREKFIVDMLEIAEKMNVKFAPNQIVRMLDFKNNNDNQLQKLQKLQKEKTSKD